MMRFSSRWWWDLSTAEFAAGDFSDVVAIFPVAAVEQHGPHLPVRVDAAINAGIVARLVETMPEDLPAVVLPMLPVGKSNEHMDYPGTLTLSYETLARVWIDIGESVHRAGCRRILFVNSHGGQPQVMEIVLRELRIRLGMLAVGCDWSDVTRMDDLFSPGECRHGIHGGEIETSVMRFLHPNLVSMERAADFVPLSVPIEQAGRLLTPEGGVRFGWMAQDLHPAGVAGNAASADAERGAVLVERAAAALIRLTREISEFPLTQLERITAFDEL